MHTALFVIAQGRGDDLDDGVGILVIVALVILAVLTIAAVAALVIRRSRRPGERTGPGREPQEPGHGGRVSGMERDRARR